MPNASRKQIALVHIAKKELGLSEEDYRDILSRIGGADSSKELDQLGFELVMQHMIALGFKSDFTVRFFGHRPGMATPAQVGLIRQLWTEYTGGQGDDVTLGKWLDHSFGVTALRFVDFGQARKVIAALKAMKQRRHPSRKAG